MIFAGNRRELSAVRGDAVPEVGLASLAALAITPGRAECPLDTPPARSSPSILLQRPTRPKGRTGLLVPEVGLDFGHRLALLPLRGARGSPAPEIPAAKNVPPARFLHAASSPIQYIANGKGH